MSQISISPKKKKQYIPHLAEFYFHPDYDWSITEAALLYQNTELVGGDKILYQDCIKGMNQLPAECIDLVIADPPFGINFSGKETFYNRKQEFVMDNYLEINENYAKFSEEWISQLPRVMKHNASGYIFSGYTNLKFILNAIDHAGLYIKNHLIWHYPFGIFTKTKFVSSHFHLLLVVKDPRHYFFNRIEHYVDDVWEIKRGYAPGQKKNGTKLPTKVVQRCLDYSSKPGDVILDPFMGNGTTAIVAKQHFRHYVGFEQNNKLQPIISNTLDLIIPGEKYLPYDDRIASPEELAKKPGYQLAYRKYCETHLKSRCAIKIHNNNK